MSVERDSMRSWMLTFVALVPSFLALACGRNVETGRRCVGANCDAGGGQAGTKGAWGAGAGGGAASTGAGSGAREALEVHLEDAQAMRVEIITVACPGECVDIEAVASGGAPPYTFEWQDGDDRPRRTVCLHDSTTLVVTARDSGHPDGEFGFVPQEASATVSADVLTCSLDGGALDAGSSEDASSMTDEACRQFSVGNAKASCAAPEKLRLCPGGAMLVYDLPKPVEVGESLCFNVQSVASLPTSVYIWLASECTPLDSPAAGLGYFHHGTGQEALVGWCSPNVAQRVTQIGFVTLLGTPEQVFDVAQCGCPEEL